MSDELKPCPFCGQTPEEYTGLNLPVITCGWCHCEVNSKDWNKRPLEDALNAEIRNMAAILDVTLNAGVEPSRLELVEMQDAVEKMRAALAEIVDSEYPPFGPDAHGLKDIARRALAGEK